MNEKLLKVNSAIVFEVDEEFTDERYMKLRIRAMHTNLNLNNSDISKEATEEALPTFKNIPILAEVKATIDEDGNEVLDYTAHAMHSEDDKFNEGKKRIIYDEKIVGIIPENNEIELVYNDKYDWYDVYVTGYLYRAYGNYVCDILESRGGETDVSMELIIEDMSSDAEEKKIIINKFKAHGLTLLGNKVRPGMEGASASIKSFSNNDDVADDKIDKAALYQIIQDIKNITDNYKENFRKEDATEMDNEITSVDKNKLLYSVTNKGISKNFEISLSDIQVAFVELINATYGDEDHYYAVEVYPESSYVVMVNYWYGDAYRQNYEVNENNEYSLVGERVSVKAVYLTEEEEKAVDDIRKNYNEVAENYAKVSEELANVSSELGKYKSEPEKLEILNSQEYAQIFNDENFVAFKEQAAHFDLSVEEVKAKADEILLAYAKSGKLNFSANEDPNKEVKNIMFGTERKNNNRRYGDAVEKYRNKTN